MCLSDLLFSKIKENDEEGEKREWSLLKLEISRVNNNFWLFWFPQLVSSKLMKSRQSFMTKGNYNFHNKHNKRALVEHFKKQPFSSTWSVPHRVVLISVV